MNALTAVIIDDDPVNRQLLSLRLKLGGFEVVESADGEEGVRVVTTLIPDLVVTDVTMPRLDGWGVCKALKGNAKTAGIPILMMTAMRGSESELRGFESGADEYLQKPWSGQDLAAAVEGLLPQSAVVGPA